MPGSVTLTEASAQVTSPAATEWTAVIIGCASTSPIAAGLLSTVYGDPYTFRTDYGYGDGVDLLTHALAQTDAYPAQPPMAFYRAPSSNDGGYGTIDNTGMVGTAVPANGAVTPLGTYQPYGIVEDGGILGLASPAITIRWSLDGGRTLSAKTALGSATSYTFPNGEASFTFSPSTTNAAYVALAVELRADALAHLANVTAHDGADTSAAQIALAASSAPGTVTASTAVVNLVLAALLSHVVNIASVHDGPDLVAYAALAALVAATGPQTGIDLANALKAIINTHDAAALAAGGAGALHAATATTVAVQTLLASDLLSGGIAAILAQPRRLTFTTAGGTAADAPANVVITGTDYAGTSQNETLSLAQTATSVTSAKAYKTIVSLVYAAGDGTGATIAVSYSNGVHNSADATNTISAADATYGTLLAGDFFSTTTTPPTWDLTDLYDGGTDPPTGAFAVLAEDQLDFAVVAIAEPVVAGDFPSLTAGLDYCESQYGKRIALLVRFRDPTPGETDAAYVLAFGVFSALNTDDRISVCFGSCWLTDALTARRYERSFMPAFLKRVMSFVNQPAEKLAHNPAAVADGPLEGVSLTDDAGNLIAHDENKRGGIEAANGIALYRIPNQQYRDGAYVAKAPVMKPNDSRILVWMDRQVANAMERVAVAIAWSDVGGKNLYDPATLLLDEDFREATAGTIREELSRRFANEIRNPDSPELVQIDQAVTVDEEDVDISGTISPWFFGWTRRVSLKFSARR